MEFLYPAPSDPDHVILVLFIVELVTLFIKDSRVRRLTIPSAKKNFRLMLYEWWASKPLTTAMKHGQNGLLLDSSSKF